MVAGLVQRAAALRRRHEGDADRRQPVRRLVAVRDDDNGAGAAVDHPLGRGPGSDLADHAALARTDDDEARVLLVDHVPQCARHAHWRQCLDDTRAHLNAVLVREICAQALELLAEQVNPGARGRSYARADRGDDQRDVSGPGGGRGETDGRAVQGLGVVSSENSHEASMAQAMPRAYGDRHAFHAPKPLISGRLTYQSASGVGATRAVGV